MSHRRDFSRKTPSRKNHIQREWLKSLVDLQELVLLSRVTTTSAITQVAGKNIKILVGAKQRS